jgi:hypothetical protein
VGVGVYVGKERVQGFKKVQTRLTALVQIRFKKVQTRLTALVQIRFKKVQTRLTALVQRFKGSKEKS